MDTVLNSLSGPYIQTFEFEKTGIMIGYLHKEKTSESMAKTLIQHQEKFIMEKHHMKCLFSYIVQKITQKEEKKY